MRDKHTVSITEYIGWLFKEYYKVKQQTAETAAYRLVDIKQNLNGKTELTVQLARKNIIFKTTPEEVLADNNLTELFSSKDIRTITYYACKQLNRPKNQLVIQRFSEKLNRIIFGISHVNKKAIEEKTAQEISLNKELIKNLSPEDAHMVGFAAASEKEPSVENEKAFLRKKRDEQPK